jgi:hypothetical protein
MPFWFQLMFAFIALAIIVVAFFILLKTGVIVTKDGKGWGFSIGGKKKKEIASNPHQECPHIKDVILVMAEVMRLTHEKFIIADKLKIKNQMNYAEQKLDQMRTLIFRDYNLIAVEKSKQSLSLENNARYFKLLLKDAQTNLRNLLRGSFIDNGFDVISERDYDIYFEEKFDFIKSQLLEMITDNYTYEEYVTLEELKGVCEKNEHKIKDMFKDIFSKAREIGIDTNLKVLQINERIEQAMKRSLGVSCDLGENVK